MWPIIVVEYVQNIWLTFKQRVFGLHVELSSRLNIRIKDVFIYRIANRTISNKTVSTQSLEVLKPQFLSCGFYSTREYP